MHFLENLLIGILLSWIILGVIVITIYYSIPIKPYKINGVLYKFLKYQKQQIVLNENQKEFVKKILCENRYTQWNLMMNKGITNEYNAMHEDKLPVDFFHNWENPSEFEDGNKVREFFLLKYPNVFFKKSESLIKIMMSLIVFSYIKGKEVLAVLLLIYICVIGGQLHRHELTFNIIDIVNGNYLDYNRSFINRISTILFILPIEIWLLWAPGNILICYNILYVRTGENMQDFVKPILFIRILNILFGIAIMLLI